MVDRIRVYDRQHIKEGIEWITDPLHLTTEKLKELSSRSNQVVFDTCLLSPAELAKVYLLGEQTGIPVVQRDYTIRQCTFNGAFNYNDGEYIGDKAGFQVLLDNLFESIAYKSQEEINARSLL